ncbi:type III polyketide synthase [Patulibacter sp.]|uniref:type III polyketide synthase n=1 Tax=Patulibacter sp. TaxID=1912859 RepID=UPI0027217962|nr:type III polyketide synthase [Patulibacter sp.]MDO9408356.1 type III polyketide synthase [Patulibacter sp.]
MDFPAATSSAAPAVLAAAAPRTLAVPVVVGIGTALPPDRGQREIWDTFFGEHYGNRAAPEQIFMNSGVDTRHAAVDPRIEDVANWGTEQRMKRFLEEAMPLGRAAIEACLEDAGIAPADVGQLTVVSCTGYATPGLDVLLARELGLGLDAQRLHIGHMGCYAAVPGLATVADGVAARGRVSIMLCLELTSLHVQPPTRDLEQVVAHALFSDAATAVAVAPDAAAGLEVVDVVARTDTDHREKMRWDVTDQGFRMALSSKVPVVLEQHVEGVVEELLAPRGLTAADVRGWAVHPGGPKIIDVVRDRLGLQEDDVRESRGVLRDHGNCSSATALLVLDRIRQGRELRAGDPVILMAFGPGLTLYAALLRVRG